MSAAASAGPQRPTRSRLGSVRLGDCLASRDNNFDLLRLLAAWAVLVSHSFALVDEEEPLHQFGGSLGGVGVMVFFGVSGMLIRRSWEYDPRPRDFWAKRALRLLPALATVGVLTAFVLGPIVTTVSLATYFTSWETWIYAPRVTFLLPFGAELPGVFDDLVYAGAVNGPLWSLPVEVLAYVGLFVLGVTGLLKRRGVVTAVAALSLVWAAGWVTITPPAVAAVSVLAAFALGAAAYSWADRIVLSWPIALVMVVLFVVAGLGPYAPQVVVWTVCMTYLSYWFAYALPPFGKVLTRFGDASYGVYIWAWPIQQTIVQVAGNDASPWLVIVVATPIVWLLAIASWKLVEAPALRHKPRPSHPTDPA